MKWFAERLHGGLQERIRMDRPIYEGNTDYQFVQIFENDILGRVLALDHVVQTTEKDEFIYHEMLTHMPLFALGDAENVLIIGGGDGGCLEEVLKHGVKQATMVELDQVIVEICRQHLPSICKGAFEDPRTRLIIGDGAAFVKETSDRFDVIIIDSTDPIGPGTVLFEQAFYENCRNVLTDRGILITQNGVPMYQLEEFDNSLKAFQNLFRECGFYFASVPTYMGGDMAFGWASKGTDMTQTETTLLQERYGAAGLETQYYNPEIHKAALARPNYLKRDR